MTMRDDDTLRTRPRTRRHPAGLPALTVMALLAACGPTGNQETTSSSSSGASGNSSGGGSSGQASSSSSGGSSSGGLHCPELVCALYCEFGFRTGPDGCPTCACIPDPRGCDQLSPEECRGTDRCALVQSGAGGSTTQQCCARLADGSIDCTGTPPPPVCQQDYECAPGQRCNTTDFCEPPPGCGPEDACPAVCYGRCVPAQGGCASDHDCSFSERCEFVMPAPCEDPNNCAVPQIIGQCVQVACPEIVMLCADGTPPRAYQEVPHGCPVPICDGDCATLPPDQCQARADCEAIFYGAECDCSCDSNGMCPPCSCPAPVYECRPRAGCFGDAQCAPGEFCDFTFNDCPDCAIPARGICRPRGAICENLDEMTCQATAGCTPAYGEQCAPCAPGDVCPCERGYLGCRPVDVTFCSQDRDCGAGYRCNLCPAYPGCPECDACGPPVCEPAPVERCTSDDACGPGRHCAFEVCTASFPPSCVGICVDTPQTCENLDEARCGATAGCQPLYRSACNDGCHDELGRRTSCGPCLAIACEPGMFVGCEAAPSTCCSDFECGRGESCVFPEDGSLGRCEGVSTCGGLTHGQCPAGSECVVVGCGSQGGSGSSPGGGGGSQPPPDDSCIPQYACTPVSGCQADADCGPGMVCNTCPGDPTCPLCDVCGAPRCESAPPPACDATTACPDGCACRNGACVGPDDGACPVRPFRFCTEDSQCLADEYCQRCPPGAACFVEDHCAPRERPDRMCAADRDCLADEHCSNGVCTLGAPGLRECSSNLECRPDEYCQICPPNALCLLPDHCEPRTFRTCESDMQCLPDEYCARCPEGAACLVPDNCQVRGFRECSSDAECNSGEHCEMCPPNALCFVADHCVPN